MAASARLVVLVDPKEKRKLEAEAKEAKVSVGEIARRRISGYPNRDEQAFMEALVDLGRQAEDAVKRFDEREQRATLLDASTERALTDARAFIDAGLRSGEYPTIGALIAASLAPPPRRVGA